MCDKMPELMKEPNVEEKSGYFFEGAEKLLEVWFAKGDRHGSNNEGEAGSLRKIPRDELNKMLDIAGCHILHARSSKSLDSYVLSESSLFVSDHRLILKTCGTTRLLDALPHLLALAARYASLDTVSNVYYSRKNFIRPTLQPDPHKSFHDEVEILSRYFPTGEAYCMGPLNSEDRWYLFAMNGAHAPPSHLDHTLEIQMTDVPAEVLRVYSQEVCSDGRECTRKSGLAKVLPFGSQVHEELFEPVGYSMNALVGESDQYVTVHVTPEPDFCYVSFETNQRRECLYKQTMKVLECFKPEKFLVTLFATNESNNGKTTQLRIWNDEIPGYRRLSLQFIRLGYDTLVYAHFVKCSGGEVIGRALESIPCDEEEEDEEEDLDDGETENSNLSSD